MVLKTHFGAEYIRLNLFSLDFVAHSHRLRDIGSLFVRVSL